MMQIDPTEHQHTQKQFVRSFLLERGWRRCGRTKKAEVYKKTVRTGGEKLQYRVKFGWSYADFAQFHPKTQYQNSYWSTLERGQWNQIEELADMAFVRTETVPAREVRPLTDVEEDLELADYFDRLGLTV